MPMWWDPMYFVFIAPALILGLWAQARVKSTFHQASQVGASVTGAQAARRILDQAGLQDVRVEEVQGFLSDHYDPRHKVLRLSPAVYRERSMAAVGVAAHEAGHALQDARNYVPLMIRNAAVPVASFGSGISIILILAGFMFQPLLLLGILAFSTVVFFQVVNLPVEFNASTRAKEQLSALGIAAYPQQEYVEKVLRAAAWTYVAATLQTVLMLAYYLYRFSGRSN